MTIITLPVDHFDRLATLGEMEDFITLAEGEDYWLESSEFIPVDADNAEYPHLNP